VRAVKGEMEWKTEDPPNVFFVVDPPAFEWPEEKRREKEKKSN
jgi:hypothetical protein